MRKQEAERQEARAKDRADEAPLRAELAAAGFPVETVWDFVQKRNGPTIADTERFPFGRYEAAIPILLRWLPRLENQVVKEWVIRALSVPWAGSDVVAALALELRRPDVSDGSRFAAGDALATILGKGDVDTLLDLAADERNGRGRTMIVLGLASIRDPRIPPLLMRLLADETVAAQAVAVLGKLQVAEARSLIEPFLTHGNALIRTEARKAIARIDRPKRVRSRSAE
ncbi:MAG: HEAT repeat domain-containing protein [Bauldia sp.]|nr:HEAT repeat domain-containing protein [Bauldia sp.]